MTTELQTVDGMQFDRATSRRILSLTPNAWNEHARRSLHPDPPKRSGLPARAICSRSGAHSFSCLLILLFVDQDCKDLRATHSHGVSGSVTKYGER